MTAPAQEAGPLTAAAYDVAAERFRQARMSWLKARKEAQRMVAAALEECEAAEAALEAFESDPGVPLPQYRPDVLAGIS